MISPSVFCSVVEQIRADRQQIAAGEIDDLLDLAEARAHHLRLVAVLLVVVVDPRHRLHARIVVGGNLGAALLLVVVVDAADERRDQRHARLGARHGLREAEEQRQVAVNPLALELRGGANALPRAADLDQDALAADARAARTARSARAPWRSLPAVSKLSRASTSVETRPGTIFRISRPKFTASRSMNASVRFDSAHAGAIGVRERRFDERPVLRLLRRLQQQRRIGRRILRPELPHRLDVAGIGDDGGHALQGIEKGHGEIKNNQ